MNATVQGKQFFVGHFAWPRFHPQAVTETEIGFVCLMSYFYHNNIVARSDECGLHHGFYMSPENSFLKWFI